MTKVLLVEDDRDSRESLARLLQRKGYAVTTAADGTAAVVAALGAERPDVVLMDLSLPGATGWEAVREIRRDKAGKGLKIVALTAHATSGDRDEAFAAGCDAFETKPVDLERLIRRIEEFTDG